MNKKDTSKYTNNELVCAYFINFFSFKLDICILINLAVFWGHPELAVCYFLFHWNFYGDILLLLPSISSFSYKKLPSEIDWKEKWKKILQKFKKHNSASLTMNENWDILGSGLMHAHVIKRWS